jgi:hypothetical protein
MDDFERSVRRAEVDRFREVSVCRSLLGQIAWLRRIGPAHFSHINFRGPMRFGVEKYAEALVQRGPRYPARVAS